MLVQSASNWPTWQVRKETNNPIWQEPFYFQFENMSVQDLDRAKIVFNVYDKNHLFIRNSHVGQFEADWTNIYFRRYAPPQVDSTRSTGAGSHSVTPLSPSKDPSVTYW